MIKFFNRHMSKNNITKVCCSYNTDPHTYVLCENKPYVYDEIVGFGDGIQQVITLDMILKMWMREDIHHNRWLFVKDDDITMVNYITKGDIPVLVYLELKWKEEYNVVHIRFVNINYNYETQQMLEELRCISGRIDDRIHKEITYRVDEVSQGEYSCWEYRSSQEFVNAHIIK